MSADLLTVSEAATRTGSGRLTLIRNCNRGVFPQAFRDNGRWVIPLRDLLAAGYHLADAPDCFQPAVKVDPRLFLLRCTEQLRDCLEMWYQAHALWDPNTPDTVVRLTRATGLVSDAAEMWRRAAHVYMGEA